MWSDHFLKQIWKSYIIFRLHNLYGKENYSMASVVSLFCFFFRQILAMYNFIKVIYVGNEDRRKIYQAVGPGSNRIQVFATKLPWSEMCKNFLYVWKSLTFRIVFLLNYQLQNLPSRLKRAVFYSWRKIWKNYHRFGSLHRKTFGPN